MNNLPKTEDWEKGDIDLSMLLDVDHIEIVGDTSVTKNEVAEDNLDQVPIYMDRFMESAKKMDEEKEQVSINDTQFVFLNNDVLM